MEPLTLTIVLDLDKEVQGRWHSGLAGYEGDGTPIEGAFPEQRTFADAVLDLTSRALLAEVTKDRDEWSSMRKRVATITDEEIRTALAPLITKSLEGTIQRTNDYGEPVGPATTLRDMIVAQVNDALTKPRKRDGSSFASKDETLVQAVVREHVERALTNELTEAVAVAKADVVGAVRSRAADVLAKAVVDGVTR
jgi:hypothetical protein